MSITTSKSKWFESLPLTVQRALDQAYRRVSLVASKQLFWERVLNDAQRERLGDPHLAFKQFGGVVGVWRKLYGGSQPRAVIETAVRLKHLDREDRDWLLEAIGEPLDPPQPIVQATRPNWDRDTGRLTFEGKLIRRVRSMRQSNIVKILDAFQNREWPTSISNPLTLGQQQAHETVRSLNDGLKAISFHVSDGGETVFWESL